MWRSETDGAHENFGIVRKGYDREAVDRSLAELRTQLQQALERIAKLEAELAQSRQLYDTLHADTRLALSDPERASKLLGQEASEVLKSANDAALGLRRKAESTAKDLVERARREAGEIARQAKLAAESELEEARQSARTHLEEVRQQSQEILAMADSTASSTVEAAKREGRSLVFRAREHAANLTQQAENKAAFVREEISTLDLERQHLIGLLKSAQDLVRTSLSSLDTRPLAPGAPRGHAEALGASQGVAAGQSDGFESEDSTEDGSVLTGQDATRRDQEAIEDTPTTESSDLDRLPTDVPQDASAHAESGAAISNAPKTGDLDDSKPEMTLEDVAHLIELAAAQTAALELDDDPDDLAESATDYTPTDKPTPKTFDGESDDEDPADGWAEDNTGDASEPMPIN
jgi:cell division septum initiation protein DivIVA